MLPLTNLPYRTTAAYRLSVVKADWRIVRTGALIYELNPNFFKKEMKKYLEKEKRAMWTE